jgi:hypothetical protein
MVNFKLIARSDESLPAPAVDTLCDRITVILGANGTGKSKLIERMLTTAVHEGRKRNVLQIESVRAFNDNLVHVGLGPNASQNWNHPERTHESYIASRTQTLKDRVYGALRWLQHRSQAEEISFSRATVKWAKEGRLGDPPAEPVTAIQRAFGMFSEIFPDIQLFITPNEQVY